MFIKTANTFGRRASSLYFSPLSSYCTQFSHSSLLPILLGSKLLLGGDNPSPSPAAISWGGAGSSCPGAARSQQPRVQAGDLVPAGQLPACLCPPPSCCGWRSREEGVQMGEGACLSVYGLVWGSSTKTSACWCFGRRWEVHSSGCVLGGDLSALRRSGKQASGLGPDPVASAIFWHGGLSSSQLLQPVYAAPLLHLQ